MFGAFGGHTETFRRPSRVSTRDGGRRWRPRFRDEITFHNISCPVLSGSLANEEPLEGFEQRNDISNKTTLGSGWELAN